MSLFFKKIRISNFTQYNVICISFNTFRADDAIGVSQKSEQIKQCMQCQFSVIKQLTLQKNNFIGFYLL